MGEVVASTRVKVMEVKPMIALTQQAVEMQVFTVIRVTILQDHNLLVM